jgi:hypothetical protein
VAATTQVQILVRTYAYEGDKACLAHPTRMTKSKLGLWSRPWSSECAWARGLTPGHGADRRQGEPDVKPAIAQLAEHLTVECCSNQMVPGSIPGGRIYVPPGFGGAPVLCVCVWHDMLPL